LINRTHLEDSQVNSTIESILEVDDLPWKEFSLPASDTQGGFDVAADI
jgi:hypothetical protein